MQLHVLGIDLGKTVFHLVGLDSTGKVVIRKRCSRTQLLAFTANLQVELIGMEACSGSHFLGRALREQGHEVRLMPAQYVKPYVQTNKSDFLDAEAIAEAVQRPRMRFVPIKTEEQLDRWIESFIKRRKRMKTANGSRRYQESVRSPRQPWSLRWATEAPLEKDEIWRPGWGSFRESTLLAGNRNYLASANGAIRTYEDFSFRVHAAYCNSDTSRLPV